MFWELNWMMIVVEHVGRFLYGSRMLNIVRQGKRMICLYQNLILTHLVSTLSSDAYTIKDGLKHLSSVSIISNLVSKRGH
jgi:hypothetical protein